METDRARSLIDYPGLQARPRAVDTAKQLIDVHTGEGVLTTIWHTYAIIENSRRYWRRSCARRASRSGEVLVHRHQPMHYPLALIAMALLPVIMWLAWRKTMPAAIGELAASVTLALLGNAFVCGALSNPHDRYGARMVWLAAFTVMLTLARQRANFLGGLRIWLRLVGSNTQWETIRQ